MALERPPKINESATSEGAQQPVADQQQATQSEVEEKAPNKAKNTARKQRRAQLEVEGQAQSLDETPDEELAAEAVVRKRRVASEFNLIASDDVMEVVGARSATYIMAVINAAKRRMHYAEALLSGDVELVRIAGINADFDAWWTPFKVGDLWFVLEYRDTYIREYKLEQAVGPAPGNIGPPPMTRRQPGAPPAHIGPRPRVRRPRNQPKGARAVKGAPQPAPKTKKSKGTSSDRILNNLYNKLRWQFLVRRSEIEQELSHRWLQIRPRLLRTLVEMRRTERSCGNALRKMRDDAATFAQKQRQLALLALGANALFTGARQRASHTFGPAGRLEPRCTGHNTGLKILIYSWIWDEHAPVDWSQNLFGVDWTSNIFGEPPEKEQAFT